MFRKKIVQHSHFVTLHGGASLTIVKVRESYCVPRLRQIVKRIIKRCHGCKKFQAFPYPFPVSRNLPRDRTEWRLHFQVIGVDYGGPMKYRKRKNIEGKAWVVVYVCAVTRAFHLELTKSMDIRDFRSTFKLLIARKSRRMTQLV